jgi:hypothetical protein
MAEFRKVFTSMLSGERPTYASVLLAGLIRMYGPGVIEWDPSTVEMEVKEDFGVHMPRVVFDQVMCLISAISTDAVYRDVAVFDQFVNAVNRVGVQHEQEPPTTEELAWALTELAISDPEPVGLPDQPFNKQIAAYCRVCLQDDGVMSPPSVLKFAMPTKVSDEWADNPEMFASVYQSHEASANEIDQYCKSKVSKLLDDLEDLGIEVKL